MSRSFLNLRIASVAAAIGLALAGASVWSSVRLLANHPVLVEGNNCANNLPGTTSVPPGSCGDYDGDGLIGTAEDTDNATDRIFGTINAALGSANGGAAQNGRVTIVTSGRFDEVVQISGNVTLEAAPGVEANIEAFLAGAPSDPSRQVPGIIVNAPANRYVVLRNLVSRNWAEGIQIRGESRVTIDNCRLENNTNFGIRIVGTSKVAILNTQVIATGFRLNPATGDFPTRNTPSPGAGISFQESATGVLTNSAVTGSFGPGLANFSGQPIDLSNGLSSVTLFDNNPNVAGAFRTARLSVQ